ncbi:MAG: hypothetical protein LBF58_10540 [Deltaproteobacteria bacterium]|nr:hypothetical protein [Deltaproteobacteria bacterium]
MGSNDKTAKTFVIRVGVKLTACRYRLNRWQFRGSGLGVAFGSRLGKVGYDSRIGLQKIFYAVKEKI